MRFTIDRTASSYKWETNKPCEEANQVGEDWYVDIETLADLLALQEKYGPLIVTQYDAVPHIEIYDDWRE